MAGLGLRPFQDHVPAAFEPRNHKWRATLAPAEQARVVAIIGPLLTDLGYAQ